jgi:tetratricopeptide (TPR) repeat protein
MDEQFKYDVFISHSSKDKPAVRELAERLRRDGLRVWLDEWEIQPGDPILLKIEEGLEQSRTLVLAMSANAFASEWVTLERHTAMFRDPTNQRRRFIPLRLDDAEIKDALKQFAYVDWRQKSDEQYAKLLARCQSAADVSRPSSDPPENIKTLLKDGAAALDAGRFEEARDAFENALDLAGAGEYLAAKIQAKTNLAVILWYWDRKPEAAKELLEECLQELHSTTFDKERSNVLFQLGTITGVLGDSDQAESLLNQALDLDRKLGWKLNEAGTLIQLGWETGHRGTSRETLEFNKLAFDCFMAVYQSTDQENREAAIRGIAECYFQRAKVHKREAKIEEAEAELMSSLEWQRKIKENHELAKVLRELAELKFHERDIQQGCKYLKEAAEIYGSIGHNLGEARCFDMMGQMLFTLGKRKQASVCWTSAAAAAEKAKDDEGTAEFSFKLGQMQLEDGNLDEAKRLFEKARDAASSRGDDLARCLAALARVAEMEKQPEERKALLREAIESVKKFLPTVQPPPERAALLGNIGSYYQELEEYEEALTYFQKAKGIFESVSNLHGIARTIGSIAQLKGSLGRKNEEREAYVELRKLVDGTPFHDIIAATDINLAEFEMRNGNLNEAKRLLKSAEVLCHKYQLPGLQHVVLSLDYVELMLAARQPPDVGMNELIDELCNQLRACPQNKDGYLRYWTFSRIRAFIGNLRGSLGLHLMIVEDSLDAFKLVATKFKAYADWNLLAVPSEFPEDIVDMITVTEGMCLFQGTMMLKQGEDYEEDYEMGEQSPASLIEAIQDARITRQELPNPLHYSKIARGGTLPRYFFFPATGEESDESSESTGLAFTGYIVGWSLALLDIGENFDIFRITGPTFG